MELTITPEIEMLIRRKLATGRYASAEQIVIEALKNAVQDDDQRADMLNALKTLVDGGDGERAEARDWLRQNAAREKSAS